jgi:uncharacterized membrane protein YbaN (DUF454 family)
MEFVPLNMADMLGPALLATGLLVAGIALIIFAETIFLLVCAGCSRVADRLRAQQR